MGSCFRSLTIAVMDFADWLEMPVTDAERASSEELLWLDAGSFELESGKLFASDPVRFHESSVLVVLRPSRYEVQARLRPVGGERRLTRIRVVRSASSG